MSISIHTRKDSLSTNGISYPNYRSNYSDSSSDLEEELADINNHQRQRSNSTPINTKNLNQNSNSLAQSLFENDLPTIIINSQTSSYLQSEPIYYKY